MHRTQPTPTCSPTMLPSACAAELGILEEACACCMKWWGFPPLALVLTVSCRKRAVGLEVISSTAVGQRPNSWLPCMLGVSLVPAMCMYRASHIHAEQVLHEHFLKMHSLPVGKDSTVQVCAGFSSRVSCLATPGQLLYYSQPSYPVFCS